MKKLLRCAVLGQPVMRFPWGFDEEDSRCGQMKLALTQKIMELRQLGVTQFLVACDCGVGLYAAEAVNLLRENDDDLWLICVPPHEEQATKWAPYLRERYFDMLLKCTHIEPLAALPQPDAQYLAYCRIIDWADVVLTVYDDAAQSGDTPEDRAITYAKRQKKPQVTVDVQRE